MGGFRDVPNCPTQVRIVAMQALVSKELDGAFLEVFLTRTFPDLLPSKRQAQKFAKEGCVRVNGEVRRGGKLQLNDIVTVASSKERTATVTGDAKVTLGDFLHSAFQLSRKRSREVTVTSGVKVNGAICSRPGTCLAKDDVVTVAIDDTAKKLDLSYNDPDIAIIQKPSGMSLEKVIEGAPRTPVDAGGLLTPEIVMPLDNSVSGPVLVVKSIKAREILAGLASKMTIELRFRALVVGDCKVPVGVRFPGLIVFFERHF